MFVSHFNNQMSTKGSACVSWVCDKTPKKHKVNNTELCKCPLMDSQCFLRFNKSHGKLTQEEKQIPGCKAGIVFYVRAPASYPWQSVFLKSLENELAALSTASQIEDYSTKSASPKIKNNVVRQIELSSCEKMNATHKKGSAQRGKTCNIWNAARKFWKINTAVCRQSPLWEWDDKHALRRDHYVVTRHVFNTNKTLVNRQKLQMGAQRNNNWLHRVIRHANNLEPCQNLSGAEMHKFKSWLQQLSERWEAFYTP